MNKVNWTLAALIVCTGLVDISKRLENPERESARQTYGFGVVAKKTRTINAQESSKWIMSIVVERRQLRA